MKEGILISGWDPFHDLKQPIGLFLTLYKTNHLLVKNLEEKLLPFDLTLGRLCLLVALKRFGRAMLPSELSDDLAVTRANVSGLLNALEKLELVRRDLDSANRRRILVHLTVAGDELLERVWPVYIETISSAIQGKLTSDEQDRLWELLKKLS